MPTETPDPLVLTRPAGALDSGQLRDEMAAALGIPAPYVDVYDDRVEVVGMVDPSMETAAQDVLDAHVPTAPPPTVEDRLAAVEAEVRGMKERAAAATVTDPDARTVADAVAGT